MGVPDLFDANFGAAQHGILIIDLIGTFLSEIKHNIYFEVDEGGCSSFNNLEPSSENTNQIIIHHRLHEFKCNRPFLFMIHDNVNEVVLFLGKYTGANI